MEITYETIVSWPGKGTMTLGAAIQKLRHFWNITGPISLRLHESSIEKGRLTIVEAWPH
jgi:hypothetical protein